MSVVTKMSSLPEKIKEYFEMNEGPGLIDTKQKVTSQSSNICVVLIQKVLMKLQVENNLWGKIGPS